MVAVDNALELDLVTAEAGDKDGAELVLVDIGVLFCLGEFLDEVKRFADFGAVTLDVKGEPVFLAGVFTEEDENLL